MVQQFKAATSTLPIVGGMSDPIGFGLVANLARPGGNITSISVDAGGPILGKRPELLRGVVPTATRVGFLVPRLPESSPPEVAIREATGRMGITLLAARLEGDIIEAEYRRFFTAMAEQRAEGLIVSEHSDNFTYRRLIVGLAAEARLPALYGNREHAVMGGLMAYTVPFADLYRRAAECENPMVSEPSESPKSALYHALGKLPEPQLPTDSSDEALKYIRLRNDQTSPTGC
jgi:putative ABC transport system substrate-binding protein